MSIDHNLGCGLAALAGREPDAGLVAELDGIDPTTLTGEDLAAYVQARWRVHNRAEAQLLAGLRELGTAQDGHTGRLASSDEFSGDEVAAVLGCSRTAASARLDLADDLAVRLPALGRALWDGRLDEPKVRAISELTRDLADDHARLAVATVLPEAQGLAVMALRERVAEVVLDIDPEWAERRRRRAEARGRVDLTMNPSGTATLAVVDAPAAEGIASMSRIEALAAVVRGLGVLTPITLLRRQVGTRLLDGSTAGMTDTEVAELLAAEYHADITPPDPDDPDDPDGGDDPDDDGPDGGPGDGGPGDGGPADGPDDRHDGHGPHGAADEPAPPAGQGVLGLLDVPLPAVEPEPRAGRLRQGTVEVRLRLSTALGLDQHPGTVPGYGAVSAIVARELVAARRHGEWRVVLTDPGGHLHHVLLARRRPERPPSPRGRHRARGQAPGATRTGAIVELQVPTTLLAALDPTDHPGWAPLLAELQQRLTDLVASGTLGRPPDADHGPDLWTRRRAGAETERWIRARDRACVAPWCRSRAHRAEIDHTREHASGGPSLSWNLGTWCSHDHRAKHLAGWHVRQPLPGWFVIRTRAGVTHTTSPPQILRPLPGPRPTAGPRPLPHDGRPDTGPDADPGDDDPDEPGWRDKFAAAFATKFRTRRTAPALTPAPPFDPDDPPPF
ncbi:uncharacterized protein DUF222 [Actinomycetospora succinea]|uniref:Uncharacterized protein DUF222 n=1 Tax=Actinomycetospora succinea TaxID=663603 RepID=A0A4R6VS27_9PSEU|nr:HNH endonuclease signature motif containing protein [Actinomycetospora succinea]TDQ65427.1 uncharacterized protein DUF222 [Actinomycetospora succinea]